RLGDRVNGVRELRDWMSSVGANHGGLLICLKAVAESITRVDTPPHPPDALLRLLEVLDNLSIPKKEMGGEFIPFLVASIASSQAPTDHKKKLNGVQDFDVQQSVMRIFFLITRGKFDRLAGADSQQLPETMSSITADNFDESVREVLNDYNASNEATVRWPKSYAVEDVCFSANGEAQKVCNAYLPSVSNL
ncbi:hypothetical protein HK101_005168, partial [Irineochytrium annulatum]